MLRCNLICKCELWSCREMEMEMEMEGKYDWFDLIFDERGWGGWMEMEVEDGDKREEQKWKTQPKDPHPLAQISSPPPYILTNPRIISDSSIRCLPFNSVLQLGHSSPPTTTPSKANWKFTDLFIKTLLIVDSEFNYLGFTSNFFNLGLTFFTSMFKKSRIFSPR